MKKIYSLFLLLGLLLSVGNVWGTEVTDVLNQTLTGITGTSYTNFSNKTSNSAAVYAGQCAGSNNSIQLRSNNNNSGVITTTSGGTVKSITVVWEGSTADGRTLNIYGKSTAYSAATDLYNNSNQGTLLGTIKKGTSTSLEIDGDYTYIGFRSASSAMYLTSVSIVWETGSSQQTVAIPTFSPEGGIYTEAQTVTISAEQGASIYYTLDGTTPTNTSTQYTTPITVSETKTIKAIAVKDEISSNVASATYTIVTPITISAVRAQGTGSVFTQGIVTSCVGTTGYIQDATAAICVFGANLTVGDEITVSGTLSTYNGLLEITSPVVNVLSSGNEVTPTVKTIAEIIADNYQSASTIQGLLVKIEDATVTAVNGQNTTIAQGNSSIVVRGITAEPAPVVNDVVTLTGNIGCYNGAQIANPTDVQIEAPVDPVINAEDVDLAYDATSGEIAYTISNPAQEVVLQASLTSGDWISNVAVDTENNKVTFSATANTGDERQATITLTYTGASPKVVTVTQAPYIAPQTFYALVTQYDGNYYAVDGSTFVGGTYGAIEVDVVNEKIVTPQTDALSWAITTVQSAASIQSKATGKYIGWSSSTNLTQSAADYGWVVDDVNSSWTTGSGTIRSIVYRESANGFKAYSIANIGAEGYANTYTTAYAFSDGYVRSGITGTWGTICLPSTVEAEDLAGATFYSIVGKVMNGETPVSLVLEEETDGLLAGIPYIFELDAESTKIVAAYQDDEEDAGSYHGLVGTFTAISVDAPYYLISGDAVVNAVAGSSLPANRAYIDMANVPVYDPSNAPARIVTIALGGNNATNIMNVDDVENAVKFIENGKFFIKKNGVIYNTVGAVVK